MLRSRGDHQCQRRDVQGSRGPRAGQLIVPFDRYWIDYRQMQLSQCD